MIFVLIITALVYLPILLLVFLSFSDGLAYYVQLFTTQEYLQAIGNTLLIAVVSALIATLIATMAATGLMYMKPRHKAATMTLNQLPIVNADIVTSFSLVLLFVALGLSNAGLFKLILAHTLICLPFCLLTILPKMRQLDVNLIDAALDLGASPFKAFTSVIVPQLIPTMLSAFLLGFTLSLDDFVITQYNNSGVPTISTVVYGAISRRDIPPAFKALTSLIFLVILVVLVVLNLNANRKHTAKKRLGLSRVAKRTIALVLSVVIVLSVGGIGLGIGLNLTPRSSVLKIYNWEDYIETDLISDFEEYYRAKTGDPKFKVEYHTFADNEELYAKIKSQKADYDLAMPSEYMVEKLRDDGKGLLKPIDLSQIPNYQGVDQDILDRTAVFAAVDGDTSKVWSIPYIIGTMGIMYDTDVIAEMAPQTGITIDQFETLLADHGWGVLFGDGGTTAYKNRITMKKSARDTIGIAMLYSQQNADNYLPDIQDILNMQGNYTLAMAEKVLNEQLNTMNPTYESENGKNSFQNPHNHQFAYGLYWSCDAGLIMAENEAENIKYYVPEGTNLWTDNFVMPAYGKNDAAAYAFIDFMLDPENAMTNMDYVGSAMAVTDAMADLRAAYEADGASENYLDTMFPTNAMITNAAVMRNFSATQENAVNYLLVQIMNRAASLNESEGGTSASWLYITLGVVVLAGAVAGVIYWLTHRRRQSLPTNQA